MASFYEEHCVYLPPMAGWFIFSALLSAYNKYVFGADHRAFPCPLFLTSVHFFAQWIFAEVLCALYPLYYGLDRVSNMSWREWLSISLPCGLVTSGDVGLSNLSLVTITITFYTMVKASTPVFVLIWAYCFGIERITLPLIMVVIIIAAGEFLTVAGEVNFEPVGFALCLSASMLSGARWTLVQMKLQQLEPPLKTTIVTMRLLAPSMFFTMFFISIAVERPWVPFHGMSFADAVDVLGLGLFGAFFAISMILCEFYLIMHSTAIILMIGGVIKEMISIFIGVAFFGDDLNRINVAGCFIVFLGVLFYKITFHLDKQLENKDVELKSLSGLSDSDQDERLNLRSQQEDVRMNGEQDALYKDDENDDEWVHSLSNEGIELRKNPVQPNDKTENGLEIKVLD